MHNKSFCAIILSVALVHGGYAKCIFAPKQRATVIVQSCVAVTFSPSDLVIDFPDNRSGRYYEQGTSYSGSLLSVSVAADKFVWDAGEEHRTNGFHPWKRHDSLTLFVALPVNQACPAKFDGMITVETDRYCCDVLPVRGRCLVPGDIIPVNLITK